MQFLQSSTSRMITVTLLVVLVTSPLVCCVGYRSNAIQGDELTLGADREEPSAIHHPQNVGHRSRRDHQGGWDHNSVSKRNRRDAPSNNNPPDSSVGDKNPMEEKGLGKMLNNSKGVVSSPVENNATSAATNAGVPAIDTTCPESCSCGFILSNMAKTRLYGTDCSSLRLQRLPLKTPAEVQLLKLAGNRIRPVQLGDLRDFPKLVELHLEGNVIFSLERWVPLCGKLRYLALDGNRIAYLDNLTLSGVSNLLELGLARNQIEQIHRDAFLWVPKLEVLQLTGNRFSEVDVRWFKYLGQLKSLHLADNNIHTLLDGNFGYLSQLQTLDLSSNHLRVIHRDAFSGLDNLKRLYLQSNSLHVVPTSPTQVFKLCDVIDLSDNHFTVLNKEEGIANTNVTHLKLNNNKQLRLVDRQSFVNLRHLKILEMIESPNLQYIDRKAFSGLPMMGSLYLSHNALSTFEKEIPASLPELRVIDLSSNPLYCDCSLLWANNNGYLQTRNLTIVNATEMVCRQPNGFDGISINDPKLQAIPEVCPPRILPLFRKQYNISLGDPFSISCKASGYPAPAIEWHLPTGRRRKLDRAKGTSNSRPAAKDNVRHSTQIPSDKLMIDFVNRTDTGDYSCIAQNRVGQASQHMVIQVKLLSAYLIISHVTSTAVTLTWGRTHHARNYELRYWLLLQDGTKASKTTNVTYHTQPILDYMRGYTTSELVPSTMYRFCLCVRYNNDHIPVNCTTVSTKEAGLALEGLHSSKNYIIGGAITVLVCVIVVICTVGHFSRKYNKKRSREQKMYSDSLSQLYPAGVDSISDTTPITYENRMSELIDIEDGIGSGGLGEFPTSFPGSCREDTESTSTTQT